MPQQQMVYGQSVTLEGVSQTTALQMTDGSTQLAVSDTG